MRVLLLVVLLLSAGMALVYVGGTQIAAENAPSYTVDVAQLPPVTAAAWGVFDTKTGELLVGQHHDTPRPVASLTKLMTAERAAAEDLLLATTTLSYRAVATSGRAGRLLAGETLSVHELLFPLLIESSNDAAEAIAEHAGREAFVTAMNIRAAQLGMIHTRYGDPSGLSSENVSTVTDLARLVAHLAAAQPHLLDITRLGQYVGTAHTWRNVNPIASDRAFRGGKHGYTDEANRTLAAIITEAFEAGERDLTFVLLGSDDLVADTEALRTLVRTAVTYR